MNDTPTHDLAAARIPFEADTSALDAALDASLARFKKGLQEAIDATAGTLGQTGTIVPETEGIRSVPSAPQSQPTPSAGDGGDIGVIVGSVTSIERAVEDLAAQVAAIADSVQGLAKPG